MNMKRLFYILVLSVFFLMLTGCSAGGEEKPGDGQTEASEQNYERNTAQLLLSEDANTYFVDYTENGFFYFTMSEDGYHFYHQTYDGKEAVPFCVVEDGIVRDFSSVTADGKCRLAVLCTGEEARILEFDEGGKLFRETVIDESFNGLGEIVSLYAWRDEGFVLGMADSIFILGADGQLTETLYLDGTVRDFCGAREDALFVTVENDETGSNELCLMKLDIRKRRVDAVRKLQSGLVKVFAFEDGFLSIFEDRAVFFREGEDDEEVLIDLDQQGILASQIQAVFGSREEIKLVLADQGQEAYFVTLRPSTEQQLYASDGRKIVRVAIPQEYVYQMEFHAKKYNQTNDKSFVEVERFEGSLEDYLGKGNRPDVIMFHDQTEIAAYVQKDVLVDLCPLFQKQKQYSLDGIIPKARELLGIEDGDEMYAMAGRFRLLLRTSDGTEFDSDGKCDCVTYLKWYDDFLTENEIGGLGEIEKVLYANVDVFYDEDRAEASFTSEEFAELMQTYKEVYTRHGGGSGQKIVTADKIHGEIARGPRWLASFSRPELTDPDIKIEGIPGTDGVSRVYMRLDYPMSILSTSDCREEAFDFVMYYNSQGELLVRGDTEAAYGKSGTTTAIFSVYEEALKENIYESERPYITLDGIEYFYTEEQNARLKAQIDSAVPNTEAQNDIYGMLMEEMEPYLKGGKELQAACEILQNRVELYLAERNTRIQVQASINE